MGRGRVQLKRIENKINKQVTFSKRRPGLIKKAHEISVLCEVDVALIVFSPNGKLFEYSTDERMEGILDLYERYSTAERQVQVPSAESTAHLTSEYVKLKARLEVLRRNERQLMGEDLDIASLRELWHLEQQLDSALKNIRKRKNQLMNESISDLRKKEKTLGEQNNSLHKKLKEENAEMAQQLPQRDNGGTHTSSSPSSVIPPTLPSLNLRSSRNVNDSGEILQAEITQPISPLLPPWMHRALN